ncbi:prepilin peptidase [Pseudonocardia sp. MH-G8]|uniref:prepilin peptidase n=1 Tax=Pseudonocardia sp. MH-G8 TaxID=1854588 RepID=UPI000BA016A0|nr:prepilin peptidase [Pseudonocardia sp. MH-G8]OZM76589.1 prepilin signal peptidase PulO-like peptidase [Pseudonocardia sp. MH-G8]
MSEVGSCSLVCVEEAVPLASRGTAGLALAGALLGGTLIAVTLPRLLVHRDSLPRRRLVIGCCAAAATGLSVGLLAMRFDGIELVAFGFLACVGVVLAAIDLVEHRLPGSLVVPSYGVLGGLLALEAVNTERWGNLVTALAAAILVALAYLLVALASSGGLGSGDVKFGGLLSMAMGWQGWSAVVTGTAVAWLGAAVVLLALRCVGRRPGAMPMGPLLLVGALVALVCG